MHATQITATAASGSLAPQTEPFQLDAGLFAEAAPSGGAADDAAAQQRDQVVAFELRRAPRACRMKMVGAAVGGAAAVRSCRAAGGAEITVAAQQDGALMAFSSSRTLPGYE
jgi:hypothetical protein